MSVGVKAKSHAEGRGEEMSLAAAVVLMKDIQRNLDERCGLEYLTLVITVVLTYHKRLKLEDRLSVWPGRVRC